LLLRGLEILLLLIASVSSIIPITIGIAQTENQLRNFLTLPSVFANESTLLMLLFLLGDVIVEVLGGLGSIAVAGRRSRLEKGQGL
jgi:uncharacterized membrane protein YciS (DUF1049 family)